MTKRRMAALAIGFVASTTLTAIVVSNATQSAREHSAACRQILQDYVNAAHDWSDRLSVNSDEFMRLHDEYMTTLHRATNLDEYYKSVQPRLQQIQDRQQIIMKSSNEIVATMPTYTPCPEWRAKGPT
jgi:esterase/lipase